MAKLRHHRFRVRKSLNLTKVVVAKDEVGGANLKVGVAAAPPTVWETPPVAVGGGGRRGYRYTAAFILTAQQPA